MSRVLSHVRALGVFCVLLLGCNSTRPATDTTDVGELGPADLHEPQVDTADAQLDAGAVDADATEDADGADDVQSDIAADSDPEEADSAADSVTETPEVEHGTTVLQRVSCEPWTVPAGEDTGRAVSPEEAAAAGLPPSDSPCMESGVVHGRYPWRDGVVPELPPPPTSLASSETAFSRAPCMLVAGCPEFLSGLQFSGIVMSVAARGPDFVVISTDKEVALVNPAGVAWRLPVPPEYGGVGVSVLTQGILLHTRGPRFATGGDARTSTLTYLSDDGQVMWSRHGADLSFIAESPDGESLWVRSRARGCLDGGPLVVTGPCGFSSTASIDAATGEVRFCGPEVGDGGDRWCQRCLFPSRTRLYGDMVVGESAHLRGVQVVKSSGDCYSVEGVEPLMTFVDDNGSLNILAMEGRYRMSPAMELEWLGAGALGLFDLGHEPEVRIRAGAEGVGFGERIRVSLYVEDWLPPYAPEFRLEAEVSMREGLLGWSDRVETRSSYYQNWLHLFEDGTRSNGTGMWSIDGELLYHFESVPVVFADGTMISTSSSLLNAVIWWQGVHGGRAHTIGPGYGFDNGYSGRAPLPPYASEPIPARYVQRTP